MPQTITFTRAHRVRTTAEEHTQTMITLGTKYTDNVTGFSGIATAKIEYLTGCTQYELTPPVGTDGKLPDRQWFDESRLHDGAAPKGGPGPSSLPTFGR